MSRHGKWFLAAGAAGVAGLVLAAFVIFAGSFSVAGFVSSKYSRASAQDIDDAKAYTVNRRPSLVADEITKAWKPADSFADASGVYLRYSDDVVAIFPRGRGSLIMVEDADRAYRRYHSHVGSHWGWNSRYGGDYRGGGPGSGK